MLVALGFALALLIVLLFGRGFWAIATSFGSKRKANIIPVKMIELQADRDRLRAEHAMMARKLELRLEEMKGRMTGQMAEVSRSRNRMQTLMEQLETSESNLADREREVMGLTAQVESYKSDIAKALTALNALAAEHSKKGLEINKLTKTISELQVDLREQSDLAARLKEEIKSSLRARATPIAAPTANGIGDRRIKKRISELTTIAAEMNESQIVKTENTNEPKVDLAPILSSSLDTDLGQDFDDIERRANALNRELKAIDNARDAKRDIPQLSLQPNKSTTKANIISLTQRIKAMQGDKS